MVGITQSIADVNNKELQSARAVVRVTKTAQGHSILSVKEINQIYMVKLCTVVITAAYELAADTSMRVWEHHDSIMES
tara:strand:- start:28 stop:261 length:234 start_codon:yes stop_codon:yes gene_type:complete